MEILILLITAISIAIPGAILGLFLIYRKSIMLADAISHAILPGIVLSVIIFNGFNSFLSMLMSIGTAVLALGFFKLLQKKYKLNVANSIAITYTAFFALGVFLLNLFLGESADIDQECVIFGNLEFSLIDWVQINNWVLGSTLSIRMISFSLIFALLLFISRRILIPFLFQPAFLNFRGLPSQLIEWCFLALLSVYSILAFEGAGVILVIGLLVLPASSAKLLSENFTSQLVISITVGIISSLLGVLLSIYIDVTCAPCIVLCNFTIFIILTARKHWLFAK